MDQPKIVKILRLLKLLTGNVSRTIDHLAAEMGTTPRTIYRNIDTITIQLNTRAKALLLEEFPLAEKELRREDGKWLLSTTIHSFEGTGRFVIGLAADIKILKGDALRDYIRQYNYQHIQEIYSPA